MMVHRIMVSLGNQMLVNLELKDLMTVLKGNPMMVYWIMVLLRDQMMVNWGGPIDEGFVVVGEVCEALVGLK